MDVDHMCGTQFEEFVVKLLEWSGYLVERHSDLGADIIAINGNKKIAFQAKRHKSNIGVAAIQEVYSGSKYYDCSHAVVITNSGFTPKAVQMARKLNVQLIGRDELVIILRTGKIISND
ncbi:MAG: restriction endonuclease [Solirubrobacterales bacterium]